MTEKLTITQILERRNAIKPLEMKYHFEALDLDIEIAKIASDKIQENVTLSEKLGNETAYCKLIYQSCPMFQTKEFQEQYKPVEPFDVVKMFFDGFALDFWALGNHILKIYGYVSRTDINTIKKQ